MQIRDINKPITSKTLNETLARKYGTRLDTDSFTLEQLQDARNKIRTKLSQIETNESYSGLPKNQTYSKNKLFLDILNAAISERADIAESKDQDDDGDKDFADVQIARMVKSGMSKADAIKKVKDKDYNEGKYANDAQRKAVHAAKDKKKTVKEGGDFEAKFRKIQNRGGSIAYAIHDLIQAYGLDADRIMGFNPQVDQRKVRQFQIDRQEKVLQTAKQQLGESIVREGAEDKAELVMAAKDMVDRLTGWMEDTAEMQTESMLELADAIRDEMGQQESDGFVNTVKPALEQLYASMETTRVALTSGVGQLTGEGEAPAADMGAPVDDIPADVEPEEDDMEPTVDDEFAAAAPAAGGTDEAGRARRESRMYKKKAMLEQSRRLGSLLSKKK